LIGELILKLIADDIFDAVGGLELGAYPIATSVSDAVYRQTKKILRAFVVRKQRKGHGVGGLVAGDVRSGDRALIVDDVITTGDSTKTAIARAREAGLIVSRAVVLVDRQEDDGKANIETERVHYDCLFTLSDLISAKERLTKIAGTDPSSPPRARSA
jgi:orotate phosphoribosyltransferase